MRISDWSSDVCSSDLRFLLTGGERNDITQIEGLLDGLQARHVLADKGYDGQRAMGAIAASGAKPVVPRRRTTARSEEHTSELQSLMRSSYAVFCLKKKKKQKTRNKKRLKQQVTKKARKKITKQYRIYQTQ